MRRFVAVFFLVNIVSKTCGFRCLSMIDLGYGYDNDSIPFPGESPYSFTEQKSSETGGGTRYWSNTFKTAEHCGTHLDAPHHGYINGRTVDQIPVNRLITKAILVDVASDVKDNYNYTLPVSKLEEWKKRNGDIPRNSVILVKFGWSSRYPNKELYVGPSDTDQRYPGLSEEAAQWIVKQKKVVGVGVDSLSLDSGFNVVKTAPVHVILLSNDIYGIENLNLMHPLPPMFDVVVMPIKLVNGTGGPVRVIACT